MELKTHRIGETRVNGKKERIVYEQGGTKGWMAIVCEGTKPNGMFVPLGDPPICGFRVEELRDNGHTVFWSTIGWQDIEPYVKPTSPRRSLWQRVFGPKLPKAQAVSE